MEVVTRTREIDASPERLRELILDVEPFMRAAGFDTVTLDGDRLRIENVVGLFIDLKLDLEIVQHPDAVLALEHRAGIFEAMTTVYRITETDRGSTVSARTEFELSVKYVGPIFDATVVKRQRGREFDRQLQYLEDSVS